MNHRQLYWKYRRMQDEIRKDLENLTETEKARGSKLRLEGKIDLLEQLMRENDW